METCSRWLPRVSRPQISCKFSTSQRWNARRSCYRQTDRQTDRPRLIWMMMMVEMGIVQLSLRWSRRNWSMQLWLRSVWTSPEEFENYIRIRGGFRWWDGSAFDNCGVASFFNNVHKNTLLCWSDLLLVTHAIPWGNPKAKQKPEICMF